MRYVDTIPKPSQLEIAKLFNMTFKDIDKSLKELVDAGYIKIDGDVIHVYEPYEPIKRKDIK